MSANTLKVKRSATFSSTSNPSSLSYGELAVNNGGSKFFVGKQTDGDLLEFKEVDKESEKINLKDIIKLINEQKAKN